MSQDNDPVQDLRRALATFDTQTAARLLGEIPVAVAVLNERPRVALQDGVRILPVFLSQDAWSAFRSEDEARLLTASALRAWIEMLSVDAVIFDPSLDGAVQVPAHDVLALLRGEHLDPSGRNVVDSNAQLRPDSTLKERLVPLVAGSSANLLSNAWAVVRESAVGPIPTLAVASEADQSEVDLLRRALSHSDQDVPANLELARLDRTATQRARSDWADVVLAGNSN